MEPHYSQMVIMVVENQEWRHCVHVGTDEEVVKVNDA